MFTLAPSPTFKFQVRVNVPLEQGGFREETFFAICERFSEDERDELINTKYIEVLRKKMKGWVMEDHARQPVPFTPENFEAFLQMPGAISATCRAYFNANVGAKEKN
jgi:hypothetical protein